jgi:hypothetical protein
MAKHTCVLVACAFSLACSPARVPAGGLADVVADQTDTATIAHADATDTQPDAATETADAGSDLAEMVDAAADTTPDATVDAMQPDDIAADATADADGAGDGGADSADANPYPQATPNSAPVIDVKPWPPACADPHYIGDSYSKDQYCWALPDVWCGSAAGGALDGQYPACSADGTQCCSLSTECRPCGWVDCFGCSFSDPKIGPEDPNCPLQCRNQPSKWEAANQGLWKSDACKALDKVLYQVFVGVEKASKLANCAICGTDVYCKWKQP